jgi:hypothetical protein
MKTNYISDEDLKSIYDAYFELSDQFILNNYSPLAIAGVMVAQALTIYKTVLSPEEYELVVRMIFESRGEAKEIPKPTLQ